MVRVDTVDGVARLVVRDTGCGIADGQVAHVFERYWKGQVEGKEGRGLGLYIAKALVEAQGGRIWVESEVGVGTTFTFTLPLATGAERPRSSAAALAHGELGPAPAVVRRGELILVVDDDAPGRTLMRDVLEAGGYRVEEAEHGGQALERLQANGHPPPALILLDLVMPVLDGPGLVAELRKDERLAQIPVMLVSSRADVAEQAVRLGAIGYLAKPLDFHNVHAAIHPGPDRT
jgi:CheY-like chemotaxis protein